MVALWVLTSTTAPFLILCRAAVLDDWVEVWDNHCISGPNKSPNEMWELEDENVAAMEEADDQQYAKAPHLFGVVPDLQLSANPREEGTPAGPAPDAEPSPGPSAFDPLNIAGDSESTAFLQRVRDAVMETASTVPTKSLPAGFRAAKSADALKLEYLFYLHTTLELKNLYDVTPSGHSLMPQPDWVKAPPAHPSGFSAQHQIRGRILDAI